MYYAIYKDVRNSAWKCLLDFNASSLPVDVLRIARNAGIRVIRDSYVGDLLPGENGKAYYDGSQWTVIYNDRNPKELSRFTLAHELGHILLGHETKFIKYSNACEFNHRSKSEEQADRFAVRLLCPACVLWGLNISSADEIAAYCMIEPSLAADRAKRMRTLYMRDKFLTDPLEKMLYESFKPYIQTQNNERNSNARRELCHINPTDLMKK